MCFTRREPESSSTRASARPRTESERHAPGPSQPLRGAAPWGAERPVRLGSLTGPSRTITVEPIEMPRREPPPPPDRRERPVERPPERPRPTEEPVPAR
jgi:hypothetical protein